MTTTFKSKKYTILIISLTRLLLGLYLGSLGVLIIPISQAINVEVKNLSFIFTVNYLSQVFISFFIGYLADKLNRKVLYIAVLIMFGISSLVFMYVNSYAFFLIMFLFLGFFSGSLDIISTSTLVIEFKGKSGFYNSLAYCFFGIGAMITPILFNLFGNQEKNIVIMYSAIIFLTFILIIIISLNKFDSNNNDILEISSIISLLRNKRTISLCILFFSLVSAEVSISGWIPTIFQKDLNISPEISNYSASFFWGSVIIGRILVAILSRRIRDIIIVKVSIVIIPVILILSYFTESYILLVTYYLLLGMVLSGIVPVVLTIESEKHKRLSSIRIALITASGFIGAFTVPTLTGYIGNYFSIYKAISFVSILFIISIFVIFNNFRESC